VNLDAVRNFRFTPTEHSYTRRDTMLYALGLGYGSNPVDPAQLRYVYERDLQAVPSICCVLAHPGSWISNPAFGANYLKLLHGEQRFEIHHPIPAEGTVIGTYEITAVEDKGPDKGAILHQSKKLHDKASNTLLATVHSVLFLRGDGGCGGFGEVPAPAAPLPDATPAQVCDIQTLPQSALIYRLSGDYNPIHADPAAAAKAGFEQPILHGLCTLGVATRAILSTFTDDNAARLKSLFIRFSKPVFPGETIRTEFFPSGNEIRFRSRAVERDTIVLDRCTAVLSS
jgi:acyl dehydratase